MATCVDFVSEKTAQGDMHSNRSMAEHGKRKHRAYSLLGFFFSTKFSLVLFVLAVAEGILWAYPMYNPRGICSDPLNRGETADLQDYFHNNLDCFKNTCHHEPEATPKSAAEQRVVKSSQRELEADVKETLIFKAQQVKTPQQEQTTCLIKIALLLLLGAAGLHSSGSSTDEDGDSSGYVNRRVGSRTFQTNFTGVLLLLLIIPALAAGQQQTETALPFRLPSAECDLQCWLAQLQIDIPDQVFKTSFLGVTLEGSVTNFSCSQISLGSIHAGVIPPTGLSLQVGGLGINCAGDWAYTLGFIENSGSVSANVSNSALQLNVLIHKTSDGLLANSTEVTACNPNILISNINFVGGAVGSILDALKEVVIPLLELAIENVICGELRTLINVNLTNTLQSVDTILRPYLRPVPPQAPPAVPEGAMNFKSPPNPLISLLDYILNTIVGVTGPVNVNKLINAFTDGTGSLTVSKPCEEGGLYSTDLAIPGVGSVEVGLCAVHADGLASWNTFNVLKPIPFSNYSLSGHTGMDQLSLNVTFFVNVSTTSGPVTGKNLYEEGLMVIRLSDSQLEMSTLLALNHELFAELALPNDALAPGGACVAREVWNVNFTHLLFNFTLDQLTIVALGGSAEQQLDDAISTVVGLLISTFELAIPALINGVIAGPLREQINVLLVDELNELHILSQNGTVQCGIPDPLPETFGETGTIAGFSATLSIFAILTAVLLTSFYIAYKGDSLKGSAAQPLLQEAKPTAGGILPDRTDTSPDLSSRMKDVAKAMQTCLALDQRLPWYVRYTIPLVILVNIGMFVSSNSSIGASVSLVLTLGEDQKELPPLFAFSLTSSVEDMWNAKVYALSILIALLSGGWPYLKLVLMLICWVLPTRWLSVRGREYFLMALDALGKWSLIDAYVMVLMMTTFRLSIVDPGKNGSVEVYVNPNYGFHLFLAATMLSLAITHIILAFHRYVKRKTLEEEVQEFPAVIVRRGRIANTEDSTDSDDTLSDEEPSIVGGNINDDVDSAPIDGSSMVLLDGQRMQSLFLRSFSRWNKTAGAIITLLLLGSIVLLVCGSVIESFRFELKGLAGIVVDFLGGESVKSYSLIDVGLKMPYSVQNPDGIGVRWIQAAFFMFVLAIPLTTLGILLVLWLTPMTINLQRKVFHVTEVFNAWSSLEVYLLAVVAALLEIEQFAQFIIGDKCDQINEILEKYFGSEISDPKCFDVDTVLITSFWFLLVAAVIYMGTAILVMWVCHRGLEKYDEVEQRRRSGRKTMGV